MTVTYFKKDNVDFKIVVEPQEYEEYCNSCGKENVLMLPFSNLGLGGTPARNWIFEHSISLGYKRHWIFDDNIRYCRVLEKGKRIPINYNKGIEIIENFTDLYANVGISAFNYTMFVPNTTRKQFYLNVHAYSAMLINNEMPFRWRLKYNEDVDLCLQVLSNNYCTLLFNQFMVDKTSTTVGMKGGNQDELYKNNSTDKQILKAQSLFYMWPEYAEVKIRFKRPHHYVNWKKHFKHNLIKRKDITEDDLKKLNYK